jgi:hypothetical protein
MHLTRLHTACPKSCPVQCRLPEGPLTRLELGFAEYVGQVVTGDKWPPSSIQDSIRQARCDGLPSDRISMVLNMGFELPGFCAGLMFAVLRDEFRPKTETLLRWLIEEQGLCPHACTCLRSYGYTYSTPEVCSLFFVGNQPANDHGVAKAHVLMAAGVNPHFPQEWGTFRMGPTDRSYVPCSRLLSDIVVLRRQWRVWHGRRGRRHWCQLCSM